MAIIPNMKVERMNVSDVIPYANNAKTHPDYQVEQIMKSIDQFGFNDPIAIDEDNVIIEGHGRLFAAKNLGMVDVPVIRLAHLDDQAKKAYILAHNKLTMNSKFDADILDVELADIFDFDMSDFGFDAAIDIDGFDTDFELADGDAPQFKSVTLHWTQEQYDTCMAILKNMEIDDCRLRGGNDNGDKVCEVLRQWDEH